MINPNTSTISNWRKDILKDTPILKEKIQLALPTLKGEEVLEEVLKFLALISLTGNSLSPSLTIDLAWHEFILCTRAYHNFCEENFERYIHHTPGGSVKENQSKFRHTIQIYIKKYGEPNPLFWGDYAHKEWENSQCGSCNSN